MRETFPIERWDAIIAVNLSAAFHTIRAALPGMKRQGWGRIVNIASVNGFVASIHKAATASPAWCAPFGRKAIIWLCVCGLTVNTSLTPET